MRTASTRQLAVDNTRLRTANAILWVLTLTTTAAFLSWMMINIILGCGEVQYLPNGQWQTGECFYVPHTQHTGEW